MFITAVCFLFLIILLMIDLHWHLFQPGFGTGESSETSLQLFIVGLGRYHASLVSICSKQSFKININLNVKKA